jgi:hypothetical protein
MQAARKVVRGLSGKRSEGPVGSPDADVGFATDPAGLDVIATTLQGAGEDVAVITAGLRGLPEGSRSALGAAGAHQAYTNFFDAWVGELETITGGLLELTDRMHATARSYREVDRSAVHKFSSIASDPSSDRGGWNLF